MDTNQESEQVSTLVEVVYLNSTNPLLLFIHTWQITWTFIGTTTYLEGHLFRSTTISFYYGILKKRFRYEYFIISFLQSKKGKNCGGIKKCKKKVILSKIIYKL